MSCFSRGRKEPVFGGDGGAGQESAWVVGRLARLEQRGAERRQWPVLPRGRTGPLGTSSLGSAAAAVAGSAGCRSVFSPIPASRSRFSCEVTSIDVSSLSPSTSGYIYIHQGN